MRHWERLVQTAGAVKQSESAAERMSLLYALRQLLDEVPPLEMFISVDTALLGYENVLSPCEKELLRCAGYQFVEDLDNVPSLLCRDNNPTLEEDAA